MRIHLIASGDALVHQTASALKQQGHLVSISLEHSSSELLAQLEAADIAILQGDGDAARVDSAIDLVVIDGQLSVDHPELLKAQELSIPIRSCEEMIYQMAQHHQRIVISGCKGKTTITAMVVHVLRYIGKAFGHLTSVPLDGDGVLLALDFEAPMMVMEGRVKATSSLDPTPRFLHLQHHIAVICGVGEDNPDASHLAPFRALIDRTKRSGAIIYHEGDPHLRQLIKGASLVDDIEAIPYTEHPHIMENGIAYLIDENQNRISLKVAGKENLQYISAAFEVCQTVRVEPNQFYKAISLFEPRA